MEIMLEDEDQPGLKAPRTTTVIVSLAAFAVVMSWLSCYAVPNALIASDVMKPFTRDGIDPRTRWMVTAFIGIFIAFSAALSLSTSRTELLTRGAPCGSAVLAASSIDTRSAASCDNCTDAH